MFYVGKDSVIKSCMQQENRRTFKEAFWHEKMLCGPKKKKKKGDLLISLIL